ncbi:MAG: 4-(cytidine 5'-diphospho)-2-C-methyl-D-erythritol kinase [Candidatus Latescibacteria bacterium]|nr:4-(cytidine 5'-diphospho)-2-C-methyl-D-erythritol kinase [Candidatus Latescibacterota bacterium]MBT4140326.1 4-(cytidine 5'-diphospho)-2-C-methyl-D-erythritol kinase [Candidatus Latescibacterota bacterium]MBT5828978.1 4-(cytidine 5'-diphospho)-2-C-methyl-D-erythritol kinase [Candidatus Latescibacterota bacterium]
MIAEKAPAKLNLGLQILGKRSDGFHDLVSIFQTIDLFDRLIFDVAKRGETIFSCDDPKLPSGRDNLVCQAVDVFRQATGIDNGIQIHLEKRIPYGAGLGGGSSDAATVLLALNRIWEAKLSLDQLRDLGLVLGSDVPFFIQKGTALVHGRGEQLKYIPWHGQVVYVLVAPEFEVATGWAFANYKKALTGKGGYATFLNCVNPDEIYISELLQHLENDFLPLILQTHPEVAQILSEFKKHGATSASLSGSGSTLYGVFEDVKTANNAFSVFQDNGYRVFLCHPVLS